MQLKYKKLHPDAIAPRYATDGAACFDIAALHDAVVRNADPAIIATGLSFEVPSGHVMLVYSRSGHGFNNGIRLASVIDSDYRGELMVKLTADDRRAMYVYAGDRIAQAMILPLPSVTLVEAEELSETARGTGGIGSTGI